MLNPESSQVEREMEQDFNERMTALAEPFWLKDAQKPGEFFDVNGFARALLAAEKHVPASDEIDWSEIAKRGLLRRINTEITHPLGLAIFYDPETGMSGGAIVAPDGKWVYEDEEKKEPK